MTTTSANVPEIALVGALTARQMQTARRAVALAAHDRDDCARLLDMLGIGRAVKVRVR